MSNEKRDKVLEIFKKDLKFPEKTIKNLEIGIYNQTLDYCKIQEIPLNWDSELFTSIYMNKCISIFSQLKEGAYIENTGLIEKLKKNEVKAEEIAYLKNEDMFPEKWSELLDKHRDTVKNAYEMTMESMSDSIVCKRCKSRKVTYVEVQLRSADENSTTVATCLDCSYKWKF
tara:strand:+ start:12833 stop:13348 length:516 start_codon:yes stop_codon:yes gene_type:complete